MTFRPVGHIFVVLLVCGSVLAHAQEMGTAVAPKVAAGLMMQSGEKRVFAPCRDNSYSLVDDVSPQGSVTAALNSIGLAAGKRLYVELLAVREGEVLKVSDFNLAQVEGRCQLPAAPNEVWRAAGNEPGWTLAAGGTEVRLKRFGQPDVVLPYRAFDLEGNVSRYVAEQDATRLAIRFEKTACRDTMADAVFAWTATVDLNDQQLKGCAWKR